MKKTLLVALAAGLVACGQYDEKEKPSYNMTEPVYVRQSESSKEYLIKINQPGDWKIYAGSSTTQFDWSEPLTTIHTDAESTFFYPATGNRVFFAMINAQNDTIIASNRELKLEEAINFRDLGGIPTQEGRITQWGKLFRSAELKELSENDLNLMREIQLKTIIDLRTNGEIEKAPDTYPQETGVSWHHLGMGKNLDDKAMDSLMSIMKDATPETFDADSFMVEANKGFAASTNQLKTIFDMLLKDETPLLFHCTAGKDRTGFTSAMILSALGVKKEVIMEEYLLSNYYRHEHNEDQVKKAAKYFGLHQDILRQMMGVKRQYLNASFEAIEREYGNIDTFLSTGVGLTTDNIQQLKELYLQ